MSDTDALPVIDTSVLDAPIDNRDDWLKWRSLGIGASDVAAICGLSRWSTAYQVWLDKRGELADDPTHAMSIGSLLEGYVIAQYEHITGNTVGYRQWRASNGNHFATLDGIDTDARCVVEAKTTRDRSWDQVPDHYYVQAQWQMHTTGAGRCTFVVLHDQRTVELYPIDRDDTDIAHYVKVADEFWNRHVLGDVPPEVDGSDLAALKRQYRQAADDVTVSGDEADRILVHQLIAAKRTAREAQDYVNDLQARLIARIGTAEALTVGDDVIATFRNSREFDAEAAAAEFPEAAAVSWSLDASRLREHLAKPEAARFMKSTGARRLILKEKP